MAESIQRLHRESRVHASLNPFDILSFCPFSLFQVYSARERAVGDFSTFSFFFILGGGLIMTLMLVLSPTRRNRVAGRSSQSQVGGWLYAIKGERGGGGC